MGAYIFRRLLLMIPTILGIMAISFAVIQFAPGGPVERVIAHLQVHWQLAQDCCAWMVQGCDCGLGVIAAHRQLGCQGVGKDLLRGLERVQRDHGQDLRGASIVLLALGKIGCRQAEQGGFFRIGALGGLLEQLLEAGIRGPWKFAKAGRGRAGASRQQGSKAEGSEQPQASDHVVFLILDQMSWEVYPSTGRGAMLAAIKPEFRCVLYVVAVKVYLLDVLRPAGWVRS